MILEKFVYIIKVTKYLEFTLEIKKDYCARRWEGEDTLIIKHLRI